MRIELSIEVYKRPAYRIYSKFLDNYFFCREKIVPLLVTPPHQHQLGTNMATLTRPAPHTPSLGGT